MKNNRNQPITTAMLAKLCNVSQGTVDRALHDRGGIHPETKERILAAAKEYGYRPNLHAQSLVSGKNRIVGMVVFDLYNDYFSEIIMHLESALFSAGLFPVVMFSDKNKAQEIDCIKTLFEAGADGLILCPVNGGTVFGNFLQELGIPVVTIGNQVPGIPYVGVDNFEAMKELTLYRISKGIRELLYYAPVLDRKNENYSAQSLRFDGFQAACKRTGIPFSRITEIPDSLSPNTGIIASTDHYALRLIFSGISPQQVSGFDHIRAIETYRIPLVTVDSHSQKTAETVLSFFTGKAKPKDILIPHTLIKPK